MLKYDDLPEYCRDFLSYLETIQNRSVQTVNEYYYDLRMFLRFVKILKFKSNEPFDEIYLRISEAFGRASLCQVKL